MDGFGWGQAIRGGEARALGMMQTNWVISVGLSSAARDFGRRTKSVRVVE